jgi:hypothetical protein
MATETMAIVSWSWFKANIQCTLWFIPLWKSIHQQRFILAYLGYYVAWKLRCLPQVPSNGYHVGRTVT